MPIANYSTDVPVSRTLGHVMGMLATSGASAISQQLEQGQVVGISFNIETEYGWRTYRMPVRIDDVRKVLIADKVQPRYQTREHAARVAWRIAHDWLRAQMALIEAGMGSLDEVMMPYTLVGGNQTAYEAYQQKELEK